MDPVPRETVETWEILDPSDTQDPGASRVTMDHVVCWEKRVYRDPQVSRESEEAWEERERKDRKETLAQWDRRELKGPRENVEVEVM